MCVCVCVCVSMAAVASYYWFERRIPVLEDFVPDLHFHLVPVIVSLSLSVLFSGLVPVLVSLSVSFVLFSVLCLLL